jgi:alkanesulfonate monooxygenase SsuD/methylene tetrahydromethanopterin reductase-like flavin-dependent oxidoreductase (luciferase family)
MRADAAGYDCVMVADHVGAMEPFTALAAAEEISSTIRLGTYARGRVLALLSPRVALARPLLSTLPAW